MTRLRSRRPAPSRAHATALTATVLAVALVVLVVVSGVLGQLLVPPSEVLGSILHRLGIDWLPAPSTPFGDEALWNVRFPRLAMAVVVGASLAVAGAIMQAVRGR